MYAGRFCGWLLGRLHCHSAVLRGEAAVAVEIRVRDSAKTSLPSMHFVATPLFSFLAYSPESPSAKPQKSGRLRADSVPRWSGLESIGEQYSKQFLLKQNFSVFSSFFRAKTFSQNFLHSAVDFSFN